MNFLIMFFNFSTYNIFAIYSKAIFCVGLIKPNPLEFSVSTFK
ncbi:hypothetical protein SDC9_128639 [bioreactor metagenome]|uniref:Uncharacterized protein n=1 Tax=bioreactor metagenome TaxID=1076179 RepID=A0A645CXL0_9ZZZZ